MDAIAMRQYVLFSNSYLFTLMGQVESRIDRITAAHPSLRVEDARLILRHYYENEWSLPGATLEEVRNTLEHITLSIVNAETIHVEFFIRKIKSLN